MPERLDYAMLTTSRGVVVLPWESRRELVDQLRKYGETAISVTKAFDAVGATRPVRLTSPEKGVLLGSIYEWNQTVDVDEWPEAIWELRDALIATSTSTLSRTTRDPGRRLGRRCRRNCMPSAVRCALVSFPATGLVPEISDSIADSATITGSGF